MRQVLFYFPHPLEIGKGTQEVPLTEKPFRVWSLYRHTDKENPPELPYHPTHMRNAFLEDQVHDWNWDKGRFRYYSRVTEGCVWLLLEYRD